MQVLLVEDNPDILELTKISLEMIGNHQVETATDGQIALKKIKSQAYDLILLDDMLPLLNGFQIYETYKKTPAPHSPIIFFTANTNNTKLKIINNIVLGLITKPFDPKGLCTTIDQLVSNFKKQQQTAS
ncbi:MAG: response regulator transcription factor [Bdellovibrionaceae bacterium]|nr:response regulator transcription factor [Pseudobdellovibrionaceae bacterium]